VDELPQISKSFQCQDSGFYNINELTTTWLAVAKEECVKIHDCVCTKLHNDTFVNKED
jgi:hypothetical protein